MTLETMTEGVRGTRRVWLPAGAAGFVGSADQGLPRPGQTAAGLNRSATEHRRKQDVARVHAAGPGSERFRFGVARLWLRGGRGEQAVRPSTRGRGGNR